LTARCSVGGDAPWQAVFGDLRIVEQAGMRFTALAQRAGDDAALRDRIIAVFGVPLPGAGAVTQTAQGDELLWMGPGQWLVASPEDMAGRLEAGLAPAAAVTDQSGGWVCLSLTGKRTPDLLARVCPADVLRLAAGHATRGPVVQSSGVVICDTPGAAYRVLVPGSVARSVAEALSQVAHGLSATLPEDSA
jgi:sarcosine oxidase subunit gamma